MSSVTTKVYVSSVLIMFPSLSAHPTNFIPSLGFYSDIVDGKYKSRVEFNRGFLIEYYDRICVIRIDFDDDDETINRFKKAKNNIPHLIAVLGEMALIIGKDGTAYCGLQTLLKKGLAGLSFR